MRLSQMLVQGVAWSGAGRPVNVGWHGYSLDEGYFVGSIPQIGRLGLPSLNAQDAAAGFRTLDNRQVVSRL